MVKHVAKDKEYKIIGIGEQVELVSSADGKKEKERVDFSTLLDDYSVQTKPPAQVVHVNIADVPDICSVDEIQSEVAKSRLLLGLIDLHKKHQPEVLVKQKLVLSIFSQFFCDHFFQFLKKS